MSEATAQGNDRIDLKGLEVLGTPIAKKIVAHVEEHDRKVNLKPRLEKLRLLRERLQPVQDMASERTRTPAYEIECLNNGTKVSAFLSNGDNENPSNTLKHDVERLTAEDQLGSLGADYLHDGAHSQLPGLADKKLTREDLRRNPGIAVKLDIATNTDEEETRYAGVLVGIIIDPESIIVPEEDPEGREIYQLIGPDNPRFSAIMDVAAHVAGQVEQDTRREVGQMV